MSLQRKRAMAATQLAYPTPEAVMLAVAGAATRVHRGELYEGRWWCSTAVARRSGKTHWYAVLWPWPSAVHGPGTQVFWRQDRHGRTLPTLCANKLDAVAWAWTLAAQLDEEAKRDGANVRLAPGVAAPA
jgi:hypothetical protein